MNSNCSNLNGVISDSERFKRTNLLIVRWKGKDVVMLVWHNSFGEREKKKDNISATKKAIKKKSVFSCTLKPAFGGVAVSVVRKLCEIGWEGGRTTGIDKVANVSATETRSFYESHQRRVHRAVSDCFSLFQGTRVSTIPEPFSSVKIPTMINREKKTETRSSTSLVLIRPVTSPHLQLCRWWYLAKVLLDTPNVACSEKKRNNVKQNN